MVIQAQVSDTHQVCDTAGPTTVTRRGRSVRLGLASPEGALLKLHCYGLDEERLWEVMTAMALNDKVGAVSKDDTFTVTHVWHVCW